MNLQILHTQIFFTEVYSRVYTWAVQCIQYMVISVIASKLQVEFGHHVSGNMLLYTVVYTRYSEWLPLLLLHKRVIGYKKKVFQEAGNLLEKIFSIHMKGKQGTKNTQLVTHNLISVWHLSVYFPVHYFFKSTEAKQLARQGIEQVLPPKQT